MFQENQKLQIPQDETIVWKYLDLSKFLDLLLSNRMFMARSDKFEDQFEGTFSEPTYEEIKKLLADNPKYLDAYNLNEKRLLLVVGMQIRTKVTLCGRFLPKTTKDWLFNRLLNV